MATPPDRPLDPVPPRRPVVREGVAPAVDPVWAADLDDRVRSLRTMLALVSVLALAGFALAGWAILRDDDTEAGPSQSRVSRIDEKVDRLEQRMGGTAQADKTEEVQADVAGKADADDVATLQRQVRELRSSVTAAADDAPAAAGGAGPGDVTALDARVDELEEQLDALRDAAPEAEAAP
jgi:hypothetical protein